MESVDMVMTFIKDLSEELMGVLKNPLFIFLAAVVLAYLIFLARGPVNFFLPTILAEDGTWSSRVFRDGFLSAAWRLRADYHVFGNIALLGLGMQVCDFFYGGNILLLPKSYAIVSMVFYAVTVSLPFLLLRDYLPRLYLLVLWILLCFIPLGLSGVSGYEIIGRINNAGFPFLFIGFMLVLYRNRSCKKPTWFILCDLGMVICMATNPFCLIYAPALLWPYFMRWFKNKRISEMMAMNGKTSLLFLLFLSGIIAYRPLTYRTEEKAGEHPALTRSTAIEMGISRNIIYPVIHPWYKEMNNRAAIIILITLVPLVMTYSKTENRSVYAGGLALLVLTSLTLIFSRPLLRSTIDGYQSTYPDRYFFAQNMISLFLFILMTYDLASQIQKRWLKQLPLLLLLFNSFAPVGNNAPGPISPTQFEPAEFGTFTTLVLSAMEKKRNTPQNEGSDKDYLLVRMFPPDPKCSIRIPVSRLPK